jgi:hypothetical protein
MKLAFTRALILIVVLAGGSQGHAQLGVPWPRTPTIVVISAEGDPRLGLVDEAFASRAPSCWLPEQTCVALARTRNRALLRKLSALPHDGSSYSGKK